MPRARKLFPIYGSAFANNLLTTLARERVVEHFVASYVSGYDRPGIMGGASRDRELAETIGRELALAVIVEVPALLPKFFGKKRSATLKAEEKAAAEAFMTELVAALGRAWDWNGQDEDEFDRDLALYSDFPQSHSLPQKTRKKGKVQPGEPPFVGRVALLLDPSMLDQARRAARKFHASSATLAQKVLRQTLGTGR
jgi:hypothetical protein